MQTITTETPLATDADGTERRCREAHKLLEQGAVDRAIEVLEGGRLNGQAHALLGVARFRKEQYDQAEAELARAI